MQSMPRHSLASVRSGYGCCWGVFVSFVVLGTVCGMAGYKLYKQALQVKDHEVAAVKTMK